VARLKKHRQGVQERSTRVDENVKRSTTAIGKGRQMFGQIADRAKR